jgi:starch synthase (maltosyl-transferring)
VIPNAVPVEEIIVAPPAPGAGGEPPLILFAGRLVAQKNLDRLLEALQRVLRRVNARALICGDGPDAQAMSRRVAALGLEGRVSILGYRDDLWGLMKSAAVFISVSWFEGHPNAVLEAMACRCPLVVSDIDEHREFLDESMAWLVPPDRVDAIEAALVEALTDRGRAAAKADAAAIHVAGYTPAVCAERFAEVYRAVLAGAGGAR